MTAARKTTHRSCPLCRSDNRSVRPHKLSNSGWTVKACPACGLVYLENVPFYESLAEERAWEKSSKVEEALRQRRQGLQDRISKSTRLRLRFPRKNVLGLLKRYASDGRVLDVGCGNAGYMLQMEARHQPCGIEVSKRLADEGQRNLSRRGGFVLHTPALEGLGRLPSDAFTAVVMRAYLEHEYRPAEALAESFRVLRPSGLLIVKVPNYGSLNAAVMGKRWCGVRLPDHANYFTPRTLAAMVRGAGYRIARFDWLSFRQPTSDNMWLLARK